MLMLKLSFLLLALLSIGCFWSCWSCPLWCGCYLHVGDVILYVDIEVVDDVFLMFSFLVLLFCSWVAVVVDVILFWHRCCCWSNIKGCCCCSCSWWVGSGVGWLVILLLLMGWWYCCWNSVVVGECCYLWCIWVGSLATLVLFALLLFYICNKCFLVFSVTRVGHFRHFRRQDK